MDILGEDDWHISAYARRRPRDCFIAIHGARAWRAAKSARWLGARRSFGERRVCSRAPYSLPRRIVYALDFLPGLIPSCFDPDESALAQDDDETHTIPSTAK